MTLPTHHDLSGAIAVSRFGLGARPGELAAASADPSAWLKAQIDPRGADQPAGALPDSRDRFLAYTAFVADRRELKRQGAMAPGASSAGGDPTSSEASSTAMAPGSSATMMQGQSAPTATENFKAQRRMAGKPLREGVAAEILARAQLAATTSAPYAQVATTSPLPGATGA